MPPADVLPVLFVMVVVRTCAVPVEMFEMAPPFAALLLEIVLLSMVSVPELRIAPPDVAAVLFDTVLPEIVTVPVLSIAPATFAALPVITDDARVSVSPG